jgi:hypothetical protein
MLHTVNRCTHLKISSHFLTVFSVKLVIKHQIIIANLHSCFSKKQFTNDTEF